MIYETVLYRPVPHLEQHAISRLLRWRLRWQSWRPKQIWGKPENAPHKADFGPGLLGLHCLWRNQSCPSSPHPSTHNIRSCTPYPPHAKDIPRLQCSLAI
jgi:hypothetical protein